MNYRKFFKILINTTLFFLLASFCYAQNASPEETILKLFDALRSGDTKVFYNLCSNKWREKFSFAETDETNKRCIKDGKVEVNIDIEKIEMKGDDRAIVKLIYHLVTKNYKYDSKVSYFLIKENDEWKIVNPYAWAVDIVPIWWEGGDPDERTIEEIVSEFSEALCKNNYDKMLELTYIKPEKFASPEQFREYFNKKYAIKPEFIKLEEVLIIGKPRYRPRFSEKAPNVISVRVLFKAKTKRGETLLKPLQFQLQQSGWKILD